MCSTGKRRRCIRGRRCCIRRRGCCPAVSSPLCANGEHWRIPTRGRSARPATCSSPPLTLRPPSLHVAPMVRFGNPLFNFVGAGVASIGTYLCGMAQGSAERARNEPSLQGTGPLPIESIAHSIQIYKQTYVIIRNLLNLWINTNLHRYLCVSRIITWRKNGK